RIICVLAGVKQRYAAKLTHGCQVLQDAGSEQDALKIVRQYEEKKTFAWIHSELTEGNLDDVKGYQVHGVWLDTERQTGLYRAKTRGHSAPRVSSHVLAAVLDQEPGSAQDVVDVRHMNLPPPAALRILGVDPRRFVQSIRYLPRAGDGILDRKTLEGYTGASELSGLGDVP
ncbi:MAG TPA: hypothetical protein PLB73_17695, partial [Leptospiraceae bacterium]|nr:hypothetical protein [Leptospiraceae bacterium]